MLTPPGISGWMSIRPRPSAYVLTAGLRSVSEDVFVRFDYRDCTDCRSRVSHSHASIVAVPQFVRTFP